MLFVDMPKERNPTSERPVSAELYREAAQRLSQTFIQRTDLYPEQRQDGRYRSVKQPLTEARLCAHLSGELTLGAYILTAESKARFLVFDADDDYEWDMLLNAANVWVKRGIPCYREESRRGGHLWLFLDGFQPGALVRTFGLSLLEEIGLEGMELYPKQASLKKGPGSLIRLPFGIHRKSGKRYGFIDANGMPIAASIREQIMLLQAAEIVPNRFLLQAAEQAQQRPHSPGFSPAGAVGGEYVGATVSARIKASMSVLEYVSQLVELDRNNTGLCPLHDDGIESFSVNDAENYWHCFACGKGGSIIDFHMFQNGCDFKQAVRELAVKLLD